MNLIKEVATFILFCMTTFISSDFTDVLASLWPLVTLAQITKKMPGKDESIDCSLSVEMNKHINYDQRKLLLLFVVIVVVLIGIYLEDDKKNAFCIKVNYHVIWKKIMFNFMAFRVTIGKWHFYDAFM